MEVAGAIEFPVGKNFEVSEFGPGDCFSVEGFLEGADAVGEGGVVIDGDSSVDGGVPDFEGRACLIDGFLGYRSTCLRIEVTEPLNKG